MFVYLISYFDYGDTTHYPIFSFRQYSNEEFKKYCNLAHEFVSEKYFYTDSLVVASDVGRLMRDYLCENYDFYKADMQVYDIRTYDVGLYSML